MSGIRIKRAYDPPAPDDGVRVLVDRLWPRGLKRSEAGVDVWLKKLAPSPGLRKWFGHDPSKWQEFQARYRAELAHNPAVEELRRLIEPGKNTTLLFAAKDTEHNNAVVLQEFCERR